MELLKENNYRNKITYLSFFLAIGVVIRHTVNVKIYGFTSGWLFLFEKFLTTATDIIVPAFFIISGYLFFQNFTSYSMLFPKWKSRFKSLVIPYLFWNLIAFLFYQLLAVIPFVSKKINNSVEPFTFLNALKSMLSGNHNILWFIRNLIIYIIVFSLLYFIIRMKYICPVFIVALYVLSCLITNSYLTYSLFFVFGAYVGANFKELAHYKFKKRYIYLILLIVLMIINTVYGTNKWAFIPYRIIEFILLWGFADVFAIEKEPKWYIKNSFIIYCTHSMILNSVEKVLLIVLGKNTISALADLVFAPIITLLIITFFSYFARKNKKIWSFIAGGR